LVVRLPVEECLRDRKSRALQKHQKTEVFGGRSSEARAPSRLQKWRAEMHYGGA